MRPSIFVASASSASSSFCSPSSSSSSFASAWVACNVYISAGGGGEGHQHLLSRLLTLAQTECVSPSSSSPTTTEQQRSTRDVAGSPCCFAAVIHAYADPVYNRSSFHLAGTAGRVSHVASTLTHQAIQQLGEYINNKQHSQHESTTDQSSSRMNQSTNDHNKIQDSAHPFVGLVDHVSVMPLHGIDTLPNSVCTTSGYDHRHNNKEAARQNKDDADSIDDDDDGSFVPQTASGWAARQIGQSLLMAEQRQEQEHQQVAIRSKVYYYGTAHPHGVPLAQVRRERTQFFQSGGLAKTTRTTPNLVDGKAAETKNTRTNIVTVGAPAEFAENFNLRLRPLPNDASKTTTTTKQLAHSLTRHVRERNGGLPGLEALSLPYVTGTQPNQQQWEVTCNLLCPSRTTAQQLQDAAHQWEEQQLQHLFGWPTKKGGTSSPSTTAIDGQDFLQDHPTPTRSSQEPPKLIEKAYRVGTTAAQCLHVLNCLRGTDEDYDDSDQNGKTPNLNRLENTTQQEDTKLQRRRRRRVHDAAVADKLEEYLA